MARQTGEGSAGGGTDGGGDEAIISGFLAGDSAAVARVDNWLERAASSFRRRLREQWDDVLQDVRLEVTRLLQDGKFRGESSLKTYLWRVTSHTCLDRLRAGQRWNYVELDATGAEVDAPPSVSARRNGCGAPSATCCCASSPRWGRSAGACGACWSTVSATAR